MAAYYRERNMAAVVFTVDSRTTMGVPPVPIDEIAEGAAANADVLIAFGIGRPAHGTRRGARGRAAGRRAARAGLQVPPEHAGVPSQRPDGVPDLRGDRRARPDLAVPHRTDRHRRRCPRRRWDQAEVLEPDGRRRRRGRLPRHADHPRPPVVPVAGRGARRRHPQAAGVHRPVGLVAEVLPAQPRPVREHVAAGQGPVRLRLPADHARPLVARLRHARDQARGEAEDPEDQRGPAARPHRPTGRDSGLCHRLRRSSPVL